MLIATLRSEMFRSSTNATDHREIPQMSFSFFSEMLKSVGPGRPSAAEPQPRGTNHGFHGQNGYHGWEKPLA